MCVGERIAKVDQYLTKLWQHGSLSFMIQHVVITHNYW